MYTHARTHWATAAAAAAQNLWKYGKLAQLWFVLVLVLAWSSTTFVRRRRLDRSIARSLWCQRGRNVRNAASRSVICHARLKWHRFPPCRNTSQFLLVMLCCRLRRMCRWRHTLREWRHLSERRRFVHVPMSARTLQTHRLVQRCDCGPYLAILQCVAAVWDANER